MSRVRCQVSLFFFFFFGQGGEAYRWRVCYQRGLPRLVYYQLGIFTYVVDHLCSGAGPATVQRGGLGQGEEKEKKEEGGEGKGKEIKDEKRK